MLKERISNILILFNNN